MSLMGILFLFLCSNYQLIIGLAVKRFPFFLVEIP